MEEEVDPGQPGAEWLRVNGRDFALHRFIIKCGKRLRKAERVGAWPQTPCYWKDDAMIIFFKKRHQISTKNVFAMCHAGVEGFRIVIISTVNNGCT